MACRLSGTGPIEDLDEEEQDEEHEVGKWRNAV